MSLENPLWQYATTLYSQPGVEQCCLQLQDQGAIIDRLLFACWLGHRGIRLTPQRLRELSDDWHSEVVRPLRAVRYRVRSRMSRMPEAESCYRALRQAELAAEQLELMQLWQLSRDWTPEVTADQALLRHNMEQVLSDERDQPNEVLLSQLVSAAMKLLAGD